MTQQQLNESLIKFSKLGIVEIVKVLVENGADVNANDNYSLRWAATKGHLEVVKVLIKHGADVNVHNDFALIWASEHGHLDVVKYLESVIKKGA